MDIDRSKTSGVAIWRQIQQVLEREIAEGVRQPGDRMPTENQLAARFGVNRHTVRRALAEMEDKGLLRVEQGRGTFVHEHVIDYKVGKRTRFTENLNRQSRSSGGKLLDHAVEPASAKVAQALDLPEEAPVVHLVITSAAEGRPINVSDHYFPADRFAGIGAAYAETLSVTAALERYGVTDYTRRSTRVIARMPTPAVAELLHQPRNRPILVTEGVDVDRAGRPVGFGVSRWASDWVQLVFDHQ